MVKLAKSGDWGKDFTFPLQLSWWFRIKLCSCVLNNFYKGRLIKIANYLFHSFLSSSFCPQIPYKNFSIINTGVALEKNSWKDGGGGRLSFYLNNDSVLLDF